MTKHCQNDMLVKLYCSLSSVPLSYLDIWICTLTGSMPKPYIQDHY